MPEGGRPRRTPTHHPGPMATRHRVERPFQDSANHGKLLVKGAAMNHVWISTAGGDLLRADRIRQINSAEGVRVVTFGGSQFLVAEIEGRPAALAVARGLACAVAEADSWSCAAEIDVVRDGADWKVRLRPMPEHRTVVGEPKAA